MRGRRGRDRLVIGFTITYAIGAYHHCCCEFESRSGRGACPIPWPGFQPVSSTNKTDRHDINEIFLKVALNTITITSNSKMKFVIIYYIKFKMNLLTYLCDFNLYQ
jgi:hypothetical protein